ncbi:hypothetical protein H4F35_06520 [Pectobacterium versatile]|uniref:hypothetical protein n=1 Tax=Pectobacterium versatile TaxID=2488639 RepID=UPI00196935D3|nr:hypothetical protein [Pectobacterium versatile]MBN3059396.1 hypothetical protein [Pectobacterium versatile]
MDLEELNRIKKQTRLALPDDDLYLYRLGIAIYGFASIASFMTEITSLLDEALNRTSLQAKMGGEILDIFRTSVRKVKSSSRTVYRIGIDTASLFEKLNTERSDFAHAYPITSKMGEQILHRRVDKKGKYFEVTNEFLDNFISDLHEVSSKLYEIRDLIRAGELTSKSSV